MRAQRKCGWLVEGCWGGGPKLDCRWPKFMVRVRRNGGDGGNFSKGTMATKRAKL